jgi:hypothetical protein
MMKKVLALVMVLSMVGFAGAALQIEVVGGKAVVVGQLEADMYLILSGGNGATLSNFALGADAPLASITEMQGTADDFAAAGTPVPAGFKGEAWFFASFPGEAYKNGTMLQADLALSVQSVELGAFLRTENMGPSDLCQPGWWIERSYYEAIEVTSGQLSLAFYNLADQTELITDKMVQSRAVNGETFVDRCVPEPMTLSLLGLGALVLRRRS